MQTKLVNKFRQRYTKEKLVLLTLVQDILLSFSLLFIAGTILSWSSNFTLSLTLNGLEVFSDSILRFKEWYAAFIIVFSVRKTVESHYENRESEKYKDFSNLLTGCLNRLKEAFTSRHRGGSWGDDIIYTVGPKYHEIVKIILTNKEEIYRKVVSKSSRITSSDEYLDVIEQLCEIFGNRIRLFGNVSSHPGHQQPSFESLFIFISNLLFIDFDVNGLDDKVNTLLERKLSKENST